MMTGDIGERPEDATAHDEPVEDQGAREEDAGEDLVYHNDLKEKKVTIYSQGQKVRFLLIEMEGPEIDNWMKFQMQRVAKGKRGRPDVDAADFKDYTATLISKCLYYRENKQKVPLSVIRKFSASTLSGLYDECETINGLNDEGRDAAKKA